MLGLEAARAPLRMLPRSRGACAPALAAAYSRRPTKGLLRRGAYWRRPTQPIIVTPPRPSSQMGAAYGWTATSSVFLMLVVMRGDRPPSTPYPQLYAKEKPDVLSSGE